MGPVNTSQQVLTQWIYCWDPVKGNDWPIPRSVLLVKVTRQCALQGTGGSGEAAAHLAHDQLPSPVHQVGSIPANAADDGQWSQGLISAVSHLRFLLICFVDSLEGGLGLGSLLC